MTLGRKLEIKRLEGDTDKNQAGKTSRGHTGNFKRLGMALTCRRVESYKMCIFLDTV